MAPPAEKARLLTDILDRLGAPPESALAAFRIVTPSQLKTIDHTVITVGSHSHTHPQMSQVSDADLDIELRHSKHLLESWTGRPVHHFAFPSGDYDRRILLATESAGYLSSWTTEARYRSDEDERYRMPRLPVRGSSLGILSATMAFPQKGERRDG
jgi:peptidoglycan/xylan/chitin deacetylase (PgdA/CDA1 family)